MITVPAELVDVALVELGPISNTFLGQRLVDALLLAQESQPQSSTEAA